MLTPDGYEERPPEEPQGLLDRLNRWCADHRDLLEAANKLLVPVVVALVGLVSVVVGTILVAILRG